MFTAERIVYGFLASLVFRNFVTYSTWFSRWQTKWYTAYYFYMYGFFFLLWGSIFKTRVPMGE